MKKKLSLLFILILGVSFVLAGNCPPVAPPKIFSGNVQHDGLLLDGTYTLTALIGNENVGSTQVINGEYNNLQVSPCAGVIGEIIFVINGVRANEVSMWSNSQDYDWGVQVPLDLTVNELPPTISPCGNGVIDLGEECDGINLGGRDINACGDGWIGTISCSSTCEIDYSNCVVEFPEDPVSPPPNNPGGSSGSPSRSTTPNDEGIIVLDETSGEEEYGEPEETETAEEIGSVGTGLGAVIGFVKSIKGLGLAFGVLILALGITVFVTQRKKGKSNETTLPTTE